VKLLRAPNTGKCYNSTLYYSEVLTLSANKLQVNKKLTSTTRVLNPVITINGSGTT
jgi:hypothetical protein